MPRALIPMAAPSPSATPSAAPAQNLQPPSFANCNAATPATAWSPCASAAAWAPPASSSASNTLRLGLGMLVLFVLVVSILIFRGLGLAGVSALASWPATARDGLAVMLLFTASAHFTTMKEDLIRMTPQWVPRPRAMVFFTGLCEIAGAIGLVVPETRRAAGVALILFFIAILPANLP